MNKTKKNGILKIACFILVVTMLTVCVVSGTLAKYYSKGTVGGLTATVAKWEIDVAGEPLTFTGAEINDLPWTICKENSPDQIDDLSVMMPGTWGYVEISIVNNSNVDAVVEIDDSGFTLPDDKGNVSFKYAIMPLSSDTDTSSFPSEYDDIVDSLEADSDGKKTERLAPDEYITIYVAYKWPFDGDDETDTGMVTEEYTFEFTGSITITAEQATYSTE